MGALPITGEPGDMATPNDHGGPGAPADLATAPPDLVPPPPGFCALPALVACWQFEDGAAATTALDATANHLDLALTAASETTGGRRGAALSVTSGSLAHAAHQASLDATALTVELWINPTALPGATRAGLVDSDGEYGFFLYPNSVLQCTAGGVVATAAANLVVTSKWQHVACTYDGTTARVYLDGREVATQGGGGAIAAGNANGLAVGSNSPNSDNFTGLVDDVRIYSVARTAVEVCADSGGNACP